MVFALLAPLLLGLTGAAIDFLSFQHQQSSMQDVADEAALAAAKEAAIKNWSPASVQSMAENYVNANLRKTGAASRETYAVSATLDKTGRSVSIVIDMDHYNYFVLGYFRGTPQVRVEAKATVAGDTPICVIGLEKTDSKTISLSDKAQLLADQCAAYGNSSDAEAVHVDSKAQLTTAFTCAAGGFSGSLSSYRPAPTTDCPSVGDPLLQRPAPAVGPCDHKDFSVKNGTFTLSPGVYCDGLLIDNGAIVVMKPGIYTIKGGELRIRNNGSLTGNGVGFYFTGKDGHAVFDGSSEISLTAPVDGEMAGILMFQDRAMGKTEFEISSKKASVLLGTIYLPNGILDIKANNAVSESSAFTVIVVRYLNVSAASKLYINSGYGSTDVPVPEGLGPNTKPRLTN